MSDSQEKQGPEEARNEGPAEPERKGPPIRSERDLPRGETKENGIRERSETK